MVMSESERKNFQLSRRKNRRDNIIASIKEFKEHAKSVATKTLKVIPMKKMHYSGNYLNKRLSYDIPKPSVGKIATPFTKAGILSEKSAYFTKKKLRGGGL
jgi:hypothetical protein